MFPVLVLILLVVAWWWTSHFSPPEGIAADDDGDSFSTAVVLPKHVDEALKTLHPFAPEHTDRARRHYARFVVMQHHPSSNSSIDIIRMAIMVNAREASFRVPNDRHSRRAVDDAIQILKDATESTSS
jgi:hypothetical protein